jgi:TonB family protein
MKLHPLPLLALACLAGGCSSVLFPPKFTSMVDTPWGELPHYDQKWQNFYDTKRLPPHLRNDAWKGRAKVAVMVNRDGTVRDARLVESSGQQLIDAAILYSLQGARYTLKLAADDEAPYFVRETIKYDPDDRSSIGYVNVTMDKGSPTTGPTPFSSTPGVRN